MLSLRLLRECSFSGIGMQAQWANQFESKFNRVLTAMPNYRTLGNNGDQVACIVKGGKLNLGCYKERQSPPRRGMAASFELQLEWGGMDQ